MSPPIFSGPPSEIRAVEVRLKFLILFFSFFISTFGYTQGKKIEKLNFLSLDLRYIQIKEALNYGLVHHGFNLEARYSFHRFSAWKTFTYTSEIGFGPAFKKGIGLTWHLKPAQVFYGFKVNSNNRIPIILGPYFSTSYQWQLYPELQSGRMFWFSSLEIGPQLVIILPVKTKSFNLTFTNSLAGWTSRPLLSTETTFYSLRLSDFVENVHSEMQFGFNDLYNHTDFEIQLLKKKDHGPILGYEFEYFGYYYAPKLHYAVHAINLKWRLRKKRK